MQHLTDATFDAALRADGRTVVVKFYTDWCPDCHRIDKAYNEFPEQFAGLAFAEINSEESPAVSERFDVRGIPSFLVFRQGELVDRLYSRDAKSVKQVTDFVAKQVG
ncbi:MAG: thioredoxin family protein [Mycobacterium leprae]